jgi:hypothetical protein
VNQSERRVSEVRAEVRLVQRSADDEGKIMRLAIGGGLRVQHDSSLPRSIDAILALARWLLAPAGRRRLSFLEPFDILRR